MIPPAVPEFVLFLLRLEWSLHLADDLPHAPSHCPRCRSSRTMGHRSCDLDELLMRANMVTQDDRDRARSMGDHVDARPHISTAPVTLQATRGMHFAHAAPPTHWSDDDNSLAAALYRTWSRLHRAIRRQFLGRERPFQARPDDNAVTPADMLTPRIVQAWMVQQMRRLAIEECTDGYLAGWTVHVEWKVDARRIEIAMVDPFGALRSLDVLLEELDSKRRAGAA